MAAFDHKDLFGKMGSRDMLDYLQSRLQARDLSGDEALAMLGAVHAELTNPKDSNRGVYQEYSQFMEALHSEMPDVHDFVVSAWGERSGIRANLENADEVKEEKGKIAGGFGVPPFLQFVIRRALLIPVSLLIITIVLYAGVMLTPPEARVELYMPPNLPPNLTEAGIARLKELIIKVHHLRDPFPIQYAIWIQSLFTGAWGYSPSLHEDVLPALLQRTPATLELTLYSLLIFIPLGLVSGTRAGWKPNQKGDSFFRTMAFIGTSMPPFILALIFLAVFYIRLDWFAPGRLADSFSFQISKGTIPTITGFLTLDSLLDGRLDVFADAVRHLVMPVITLSLYNWATLGRIVRATIIEQRRKDFIVSARARGVRESRVLWHHAFRNTLTPALTSIGFSAASIMTGAFIVEIIYNLNGVSGVLAVSMSSGAPDAPAALGFTVYSVIMILLLMFFLDIAQAILDPRVRDEMLRS